MSNRLCRILIIFCWMAGLCILIPPLSLGLNLKFCDSNKVDHFGCDAFPVVKISCSDTWLMEQMVIICAVLTLNMTLICVVLSYACRARQFWDSFLLSKGKSPFSPVLLTWEWLPSPMAHAFSSTWILQQRKKWPLKKWFHCSFFSVSSMLNSFIYTLRNNQVKKAFKDSEKRIALLSSKYEKIFLKYHLKRVGRRLFWSL